MNVMCGQRRYVRMKRKNVDEENEYEEIYEYKRRI